LGWQMVPCRPYYSLFFLGLMIDNVSSGLLFSAPTFVRKLMEIALTNGPFNPHIYVGKNNKRLRRS
jgi:hypothetical protein